MIYDVILVVVLGGIGLSGGRGGIRNVHRRHAADRHPAERHDHHEHPIHAAERDPERDPAGGDRARQLINPRDEQTAQQGDI